MSFEITIKPSDHVFAAAADETILESAMKADLILPYGCRNGACGACKGRVLAGDVDYGQYQATTLTDDDRRDGYALFCCARPLTDLAIEVREVRRAGDIPIKRLPCRIESIDKPAPDVAVVRFKLPANERLQFLAGQYVDFLLKDGKRRSFSLAVAPHDDRLLELHIRHIPGGLFTDPLFAQFKGREILRLEGPHGAFYLREESDKPMIFVAGGTGFAPIKAMLEHCFHHGIAREMVLYWGARALADLYMPALPGEWQTRASQLHVHSGAVGCAAGRGVARPHGPRAPGGARRLPRLVRLPGVRLRRAGDDRRRATRFRRVAAAAAGGVLRRQLHDRRRDRAARHLNACGCIRARPMRIRAPAARATPPAQA